MSRLSKKIETRRSLISDLERKLAAEEKFNRQYLKKHQKAYLKRMRSPVERAMSPADGFDREDLVR